MTATATEAPAKPKRIRRWAKRPPNPNDAFPNASLSVREVRLLIREMEDYEKRIAALKGRDSRMDQRLVRKLLDKLRQVRWSP